MVSTETIGDKRNGSISPVVITTSDRWHPPPPFCIIPSHACPVPLSAVKLARTFITHHIAPSSTAVSFHQRSHLRGQQFSVGTIPWTWCDPDWTSWSVDGRPRNTARCRCAAAGRDSRSEPYHQGRYPISIGISEEQRSGGEVIPDSGVGNTARPQRRRNSVSIPVIRLDFGHP